MRSPLRLLPQIVLAVLALVAAIEGVAALRVFRPVGNVPGADGPLVLGLAVWGGLLALAVALVLCVRAAASRELAPRWVALLAPAGGLLALVHALGFDSYAAPTLVRFVDEGSPGWHWVVEIAAAGAVAGAVTWRFRRPGSGLSAVVLLVVLLTYLVTGTGH
jgi:hypothetical protein